MDTTNTPTDHPPFPTLRRAMRDETLDLNCKGIVGFMALEAKDHTTYTRELMSQSGSTGSLIKRCFARLENSGYVRRIPPTRDARRVEYQLILN